MWGGGVRIFVALLMLASVAWADSPCALHGRVRIVYSGPATYRVRVVRSFPDARVRRVMAFPKSEGEWQVVEHGEDFTVKFVERGEDFTIAWSDWPGCR